MDYPLVLLTNKNADSQFTVDYGEYKCPLKVDDVTIYRTSLVIETSDVAGVEILENDLLSVKVLTATGQEFKTLKVVVRTQAETYTYTGCYLSSVVYLVKDRAARFKLVSDNPVEIKPV